MRSPGGRIVVMDGLHAALKLKSPKPTTDKRPGDREAEALAFENRAQGDMIVGTGDAVDVRKAS
jgi:hypothetical protein